MSSYCEFGAHYELPAGMIKNTDSSKYVICSDFDDEYEVSAGITSKTVDDSRNFLAGNYNQWLTTEN